MTIRATKFTPEVLLSAPRRSAGIPNSDASKILYSVSTYSFAEHAKKSEIRILDAKSQGTTLVTDHASASEPNWLGDDHLLLLFSKEDGTTQLVVGSVDGFKDDNHTVGTVDAPISNVKIVTLEDDAFAIAVTAQATPDGKFFNPSKAKKPHTTGRVWNTLFVRHWDKYVGEERNSIWLGTLSKQDGKYKLSELKNALQGSGLASPVEPFGGTDHFDISRSGLIFTAKDPDLNPALHTKTNIYLVTSDSFWSAIFTQGLPKIQKVEIYGFEGASTSPVFSPDGKKAAFLSMKQDGYEADKNQVFIVPDLSRPSWVIHALASEDGKGSWDLTPSTIIWSNDSQSPLYFLAEDRGRGALWLSEYSDRPGLKQPEIITRGGSVADVRLLKNGDLFISSNSLVDNSIYSVLSNPIEQRNPRTSANSTSGKSLHPKASLSHPSAYDLRLISSHSFGGTKFGLHPDQVSETYWPGAAKGTSVHAFIVKPSTFNPDKKYPLAYLIHGGPQGAWNDSWSTRWNPAIFAEQGYIVVTPNPTGSTGYGQAFIDAIQRQWGGLPYQDLVNGIDWIEKNLSYVDTEKMVALGASYGGYMMNWIQGHSLGRKFKALVTHDGVFSMTGQLASEELYFPFHDLGGTYWTSRKDWEQWDPSRFTENWATPHLIIHNELDYRLTISEGLAAFHTLQARGVESQFLMFPDENHWVLKPENSLLWHETVLDWINPRVGLPKYTEQRDKGKVQHITEGVGGLNVDE